MAVTARSRLHPWPFSVAGCAARAGGASNARATATTSHRKEVEDDHTIMVNGCQQGEVLAGMPTAAIEQLQVPALVLPVRPPRRRRGEYRQRPRGRCFACYTVSYMSATWRRWPVASVRSTGGPGGEVPIISHDRITTSGLSTSLKLSLPSLDPRDSPAFCH